MKHSKRSLLTICMTAMLLMLSGTALAVEQPAGQEEAVASKSPLATGLVAIASALAVGLCALGTGLAQSRIGAAGCGTLAEKPENSGTIILLVAIPETMVILGFVIAVVMIFTM